MSVPELGRVLVLTLLATLLACSKQDPPRPTAEAPTTVAEPVAPPPPATMEASGGGEARKLFATRCAVCHGTSGKGDGPGAAALNPKPRDYTNAEWQKGVTDDDIRKTIVLGGPATGKSAGMPPNPDLQSKPEVVDALVKYVRSFAK